MSNDRSTARLVVVGAGGFGREVLDVVEDLRDAGTLDCELLGVVDAAPSARNLDRLHDRRIRFLGTDDDFLASADAECFVVAIGDPSLRRIVTQRYVDAGLRPVSLVHPTATVGRRTLVGEGVVICASATVSTNVRIGAFSTINPNATVGHDATLGAFVSINPGAVVSGEVTLGEGTLVGAGAVVLENLVVGAACVIGASACVTRNVPDGRTVKGVPAR